MYLIVFLISALSFNAEVLAKTTKTATKTVAKTSGKVTLEKLVSAIQTEYNNTSSTTFDFEQEYKHPFLAVMEKSTGQVFYDRALGNMLWSYLEPANKQKKFYIHGSEFTYYSVNDKIAYVHNCYHQDTLSASITFLLGKGKLKDSFTVAMMPEPTPNKTLAWLKLTPKEKDAPVKYIYLGVENGKVKESLVEDLSGGKNHFKFQNFKADKIDKNTFVFVAPKGVKVEPMPNVDCTENKVPPKKKAEKEKKAEVKKDSAKNKKDALPKNELPKKES